MPHAWHNPTMIAAAPFYMLAFLGMMQLIEGRRSAALIASTAAALALSAFMKPNYALAAIPALALYLWRHHRQSFGLIAACAIMVLPTLLLQLWQYATLTSGEAMPAHRVFVYPFGVWNMLSPFPPLSILLGSAFPIAYFACYKSIRTAALRMALLIWAVAIAQGALLAEEPGFGHGNFLRGYYISLFFLFITALIEFVRRTPEPGGRLKRIICWTVLLLHAATGLYYYTKISMGGVYY